MVAGNPDGPLKLLLMRWADRPAKFQMQRWKRDHPVTISLTLEEMDALGTALVLARDQLAAAPQSGSTSSTLDLDDMVAVERAARQVG